jgi:Tetratricopeptide repeat
VIGARGYGAAETTAAFARARESALGDKDAQQSLAADYGLWAASYVRSELSSMRKHAAAFLRDAEASPDSSEAGVAHRILGRTHWFAGEYVEARDHLDRALAFVQTGSRRRSSVPVRKHVGVAAMLYLALTLWPLGDVERAVSLVRDAEARIGGLAHVTSRALGKGNVAKSDDFTERFAAVHFRWTRAFVRGELRSARALASSFLKEAEGAGRVVEAGVARRGLALGCYEAGDFLEARTLASKRSRPATLSTAARHRNVSTTPLAP